MINEWAKTLHVHFGPPRPAVAVQTVQSAYNENGLKGIVLRVKSDLRITCKVFVVTVNEGGSESRFAWVRTHPQILPPYGTKEFERSWVTVSLSRALQATADKRLVAFAIAHEFSHVILDSTGHPHRTNEKVVDFTAMWLGYAEFYQHHRKNNSVQTDIINPESVLGRALSFFGLSKYLPVKEQRLRVGYLTDEEVEQATAVIQRMRR